MLLQIVVSIDKDQFQGQEEMCRYLMDLLKVVCSGYPICLGVLENALKILSKYLVDFKGKTEHLFKQS